jgi:NADPH:quinone reductase-like Zn-dependent oxidoreductase
MQTSLGAWVDGTFHENGTYAESRLVHALSNLDWSEARTLNCAGLTAWNALNGDRAVGPEDVVSIQETGGVSIFAIQV